MKTITSLQRCACYAALIGLAAATADYAQGAVVNGYRVNERFFNDNPGSTLTVSPSSPSIIGNPVTIGIRDAYSGAFGGVNRHDALASDNLGATAFNHSIDDSFCFTTRLTLTVGANSPRKEAGIRFNSPITGDMLFLVNSDAGEIVTFGGPFHLFGNNGMGNGYTPGSSILLGVKHIGGGDGNGGIVDTTEYFIDRGAGIETTGPLAWSNTEGGPVNFQAGVYVQAGAAGPDFVNAMFSDTTYTPTTCVVPEPGTFALLGMGLLGLLAIRRKR